MTVYVLATFAGLTAMVVTALIFDREHTPLQRRRRTFKLPG